MAGYWKNRPYTTVILAMSADGKIADVQRSPARFSSPVDKAHLEQQIANSDAVLFGAGTLRAYGTTLRVSDPQLLQQRYQQELPPQPIQIVASRKANIDPQLRFFCQSVPRWLLTTAVGAKHWQGCPEFEQILVYETPAASDTNLQSNEKEDLESERRKEAEIFPCPPVPASPAQSLQLNATQYEIDWTAALQHLVNLGLSRLMVLGGGQLVASLLAADLIDEFWLTVCPLILGGATAPTPVEGAGFLPDMSPRLELLSVQAIEQEVFLHYRLQRLED